MINAKPKAELSLSLSLSQLIIQFCCLAGMAQCREKDIQANER